MFIVFSFRNRETLTFPPFSALPHIHSRQFLFIMLSTCEKPLRLSGEISRGRELKTGMSGTRSCSPFISPPYQVIAESFIYSDLCSGLKRPGCTGLSKFSALCPCDPLMFPETPKCPGFAFVTLKCPGQARIIIIKKTTFPSCCIRKSRTTYFKCY